VHILKYRKFFLNIRKKPFYCRIDNIYSRMPRKPTEAISIPGDIQNPIGHGPEQPALADPALTI